MNDQSNQTNPVNIKLRSFDSKILYMNGMYKLPIAPYPSLNILLDQPKQLENFKKILAEEVDEIDDIVQMGIACSHLGGTKDDDLNVLTAMADLLGDIVVYCYSEAAKFGIPLSEVLSIIMDSNFSKLGADGQPIYDERGKVQKGPFYWKPEAKIKVLLEQHTSDAQPKVNDGV